VLKVVKATAPEVATDAFKSTLHMFSHWFGTHGALRLFKILTPVLNQPIFADPKVPVMREDFILRNDTFPAGTAKINIIKAAVHMKASPLWVACPNLPVLTENCKWMADK
jgi:hypothetical protein